MGVVVFGEGVVPDRALELEIEKRIKLVDDSVPTFFDNYMRRTGVNLLPVFICLPLMPVLIIGTGKYLVRL